MIKFIIQLGFYFFFSIAIKNIFLRRFCDIVFLVYVKQEKLSSTDAEVTGMVTTEQTSLQNSSKHFLSWHYVE
jgi:hypothetical protein